jgi:hypothetical protein
MAQTLTITIDFSGRTMDSHGERHVAPTMDINAHGLGGKEDAETINKIASAIMDIIEPKPIE